MTTGDIIAAIQQADPADMPALLAAIAAKLAEARPAIHAANGAPALVDAAQLAAALNLPESWLMSQARQGKIPSIRTGKYVRFDPAEVKAALHDGHNK